MSRRYQRLSFICRSGSAVVDAVKEEIVRKICLLDLKKRPLLGN
jgi:hypothetical protein